MLWTLLIMLIVGLDQVVKYVILSDQVRFENLEVIKGFFYLTYVENRGASFGMLENFRWGFIVLTLIALFFMVRYMIRHKHLLLRWSLALLVAGAVGNMIDRILKGYVVDMFHFYPFGYDFAVFNVADISINIGVGLLMIYILFIYKDPAKVKPEPASDNTPIQDDSGPSNPVTEPEGGQK